ncbi:MAG: hypothetical protein ACM3QZ_13325 [Solirubrobacterales bacterium]
MTIIQTITPDMQPAVYAITRLDSANANPEQFMNTPIGDRDLAGLTQENLTLSDEALTRSKDVPPTVIAVLRNATAAQPNLVESIHSGLTLSRVLDLIG